MKAGLRAASVSDADRARAERTAYATGSSPLDSVPATSGCDFAIPAAEASATTQLNWMKERFRTGSIGSLLIYLACYPWVIIGPIAFITYFIVPKMKEYTRVFIELVTSEPFQDEFLRASPVRRHSLVMSRMMHGIR